VPQPSRNESCCRSLAAPEKEFAALKVDGIFAARMGQKEAPEVPLALKAMQKL